MTGFLNSNEQSVIDELDRFIDGCKANNFKPSEIVLSNKQVNALRRVLEKAKENPEYDYAKKIDLDRMTYRGIKLVELSKLRPYRRRKDMMDMFEDAGRRYHIRDSKLG